jgi:ribosomal protein L33
MAKKKGGRIIVAMQCSVCKKVNYYTSINKAATPKLEQSKYCKQCKARTLHTSREKLK